MDTIYFSYIELKQIISGKSWQNAVTAGEVQIVTNPNMFLGIALPIISYDFTRTSKYFNSKTLFGRYKIKY